MKRLISPYFFALVFTGMSIHTFAQIDSYIGAYTGLNKNGYIRPVSSVLTAAFNTGQVTHTRIDSNFHVYFHLIGTSAFIFQNDLKYFDATTGDHFIPVQTAPVSTILGPRKSSAVNGINGTVYTFPAGLGIQFLSLALPQLTVAYVGTEINLRFFAYDTNDELGKINLWGAGLRHDIGKYFINNDQWILSVGGMFQKVEAGTYLDLSTYQGALTMGRQNKHMYYFAQAGYQAGKLKGNYKHYDGENFETVNLNFDNDNPIFIGLGIGLNLGLLQLQLQASGYSPLIGSLALGIKF